MKIIKLILQLRWFYVLINRLVFNPKNYLLFRLGKRTDEELMKHNESEYDFINRWNDDFMVAPRCSLNNYFIKIHAKDKFELKSRLKSNWDPAFFELLVHEIFWSLGYCLQTHPTIPESTKRPDYYINNCRNSFYVEVKIVTDKSPDDVAFYNIRRDIYNQIQQLKSEYYFFEIDHLNIKSKNQTSLASFLTRLNQKMLNANPAIIENNFLTYQHHLLPYEEHSDNFIDIKITVNPRSRDTWGENQDELIGIYDAKTYWGGPDEAIRKAINRKSSRYGTLEKPYIIFLNVIADRKYHNRDLEDVLFGRGGEHIDDITGTSSITRELDGLFTRRGAENSRISGIFITSITAYDTHVADYCYFINPNSRYPIRFDGIFNQALFTGIDVTYSQGRKLEDLLFGYVKG